MKTRNKAGFTLTEVMVSVAILGIVVPILLSVFINMQWSVKYGTERVEALSHGQRSVVDLTRKINKSTGHILVSDQGNVLTLEYWDSSEPINGLSPAVIFYNPDNQSLFFQDINTEDSVLIQADVYPMGTNQPMFSYSNESVECTYFIGKFNPDRAPQGATYQFKSSPRNIGAAR